MGKPKQWWWKGGCSRDMPVHHTGSRHPGKRVHRSDPNLSASFGPSFSSDGVGVGEAWTTWELVGRGTGRLKLRCAITDQIEVIDSGHLLASRLISVLVPFQEIHHSG